MARPKEPTHKTQKKLFALSGNRCAFPGCDLKFVNDEDLVAAVCHIEAASPGGQRFNPKQTDEQRRQLDNLILLCPNHHVFTDNVDKYPVQTLRDMKEAHEARIEELLSQGDQAPRIAPSKLPKTGGGELVGRAEELAWLEGAWESGSTHVVSIVAWGGVGKTSLVKEWTARLAARDWAGTGLQDVERYFDWSFYSQGTKDQTSATADLFIAEALEFFGDPDPKAGSPHDRGDRLSRLVAQRPTLLLLDGLEPLQYGPGPVRGELKDPALKALLKGLAQRPLQGLCVITTREAVKDLKTYHGKTVDERTLEHLSDEAGAYLLHSAGGRRAGAAEIEPEDEELMEACREVQGHALTLQLLGGYLGRFHKGDIRRRDKVKLRKADAKTQGGHAFRVISAYERLFSGRLGILGWLERLVWKEARVRRAEGATPLSVLRLLGLFDRPANQGCIQALLEAPTIPGLTGPLTGLAEEDWNDTLDQLSKLGLIASDSEGSDSEDAPLDAHPLVREYFGEKLKKENKEAWQAAHRRIYEHLTTTTEHQPATLPGLQPLYQAVAHGCLAGLHQQALFDVYVARINRGTESNGFYSTNQLGAFGADLGAVACFFDETWTRLSPNFSLAEQAWLLGATAFRLRALGRLNEALEPMRAALELGVTQQNWKAAASRASNLSELELTLGKVKEAVADGAQAVTFADRSGDGFIREVNRTTHAEALHQAGRRQTALPLFQEAEALQAERQREYPRLYSLRGFQYCDILLAEAERAVWRRFLAAEGSRRGWGGGVGEGEGLAGVCEEVAERAKEWIAWRVPEDSRLDIALIDLTLGRAVLYRGVLADGYLPAASARAHLEAAVDGLRAAGRSDYLPGGLLTRAWLRFLEGEEAASRADLNEAWEIADRGGMLLFQADVSLTRARLFGDLSALQKAREIIGETGYGRRMPELEDAETALGVGG